uniref:Glycolate oxidase iron-sulfur subunit n=1 Tax=Magnetococcus massalia (strain MO-1) TaxID=451514 RepID=A0A1S7LG54_MAGMO|nr:putative glycolate oxidase iron-sulfur subunit [Candidatus Magnetococcus massalia]
MYHDKDDFSYMFEKTAQEVYDQNASGPYIPEAADCRVCGACLPVCPTYQARTEESYSPRGRVRMIERIVQKKETLTTDEWEALNACTLCRACDERCPSKMDFKALFYQAIENIEPLPKPDLAISWVLKFIDKGWAQHSLLKHFIQTYQFGGLQWLFRKVPPTPVIDTFKQFDALLPTPYTPEKIVIPAEGENSEQRPEVALFTGCLAHALDTDTHNASIKLLTHLGYDVRLLKNLSCCGAMFVHNGQMERAKALAQSNMDQIQDMDTGTILFNASGCGAFMKEYDSILGETDETKNGDTSTPPPQIVDVLSFVLESVLNGTLSFSPLNKRVAVHEPCSHRNTLKDQDNIYHILNKIPNLEVIPLNDNMICCGAGGTKMATQGELAAHTRDEKVQALLNSGAELLLSTNLTCALHLARGIREAGGSIPVLHPVTLLAQQIRIPHDTVNLSSVQHI